MAWRLIFFLSSFINLTILFIALIKFIALLLCDIFSAKSLRVRYFSIVCALAKLKVIKILLESFHSAINDHKRHCGPRFAYGELATYQLGASARAASDGGNCHGE
jgi:hypothetical protein